MINSSKTSAILFMSIILATAFLGYLTSFVSSSKMLFAMGSLGLFVIGFIRVEFALYLLIFSMLLSPEFVLGTTEARSSLGRGITLRLDDLLIGVIGFGWLAKTAVNKELGLVLRTPLNKPIFFYITVCVVSTAVGTIAGNVNPKVGFFYVLKYFEYCVVYFMVVNHVRNREQIERFILCFLITCAIISLYGMMQIPGGGRVTAPFEGESGEPNTMGGYLLLMGCVVTGFLIKLEDTSRRILLFALLCAIFTALLFTESRSSYLAVIPAYMVFMALAKKKYIFVGLLAVALAISPLILPERVKERTLYTFQQAEHEGQMEIGGIRLDTSTSARLASWASGLSRWSERPVIGWGVTGTTFMDAQFPRILVETGLVGLIAFLYLIYKLLKQVMASYRRVEDPLFQGLAMGFLAGFVGLLFHAIGANTFIIVRIMEPFWFLAGMVLMLPEIEEQAHPGILETTPASWREQGRTAA
ncbi:MAG: O-antigen ligase family protein [Desulfatibacillaceae bacterium]